MAGDKCLSLKAVPMPATPAPLRILILGGTTEATALCEILAGNSAFAPTLSLAGVTKNPALPTLPCRIGGFGGREGLLRWLRANRVQAIIDATHPFAATMSHTASLTARELGIPLLRLERPEWQATARDNWQYVPSIQAAAHTLADPAGLGKSPLTVFLTTGRKETRPFQAAPQHHYILRSIEAPAPEALPPNTTLITAKGPFDLAAELATVRRYGITHLVTKNSGGSATFAKIEAARACSLPVIMINRPAVTTSQTVATAREAMTWLQHQGAATVRAV